MLILFSILRQRELTSVFVCRLPRQPQFESRERDADFGALIPGLLEPEPEVEGGGTAATFDR